MSTPLVQPFPITWNTENLNPESSNYKVYRQNLEEITYVNHRNAYGDNGISGPTHNETYFTPYLTGEEGPTGEEESTGEEE